MATLTPTLTLASSDISGTDTLDLSVTDSLSIAGGAINFQVVTSTTGTVFAAAANYSKSYVFLKNLDTSIVMTIEKADGGDEFRCGLTAAGATPTLSNAAVLTINIGATTVDNFTPDQIFDDN